MAHNTMAMWSHSSTPHKNSIPRILPKSCLLASLEARGKFLFFLRSVLAINETNSPFSLTMGSFPEKQRRKVYIIMIQHLTKHPLSNNHYLATFLPILGDLFPTLRKKKVHRSCPPSHSVLCPLSFPVFLGSNLTWLPLEIMHHGHTWHN